MKKLFLIITVFLFFFESVSAQIVPPMFLLKKSEQQRNTPLGDPPVTPPTAPDDMLATGGAGFITLLWSDPTNEDYIVLQVTQDTTSNDIHEIRTLTAGATGYVDSMGFFTLTNYRYWYHDYDDEISNTGLDSSIYRRHLGQYYHYRIKCTNSSGTDYSNWSDVAYATAVRNARFIDPVDGDDADNGLTPATSWKTAQKWYDTYRTSYETGDAIFIKGGTTLSDRDLRIIRCVDNGNGVLGYVGSYGVGRAILYDTSSASIHGSLNIEYIGGTDTADHIWIDNLEIWCEEKYDNRAFYMSQCDSILLTDLLITSHPDLRSESSIASPTGKPYYGIYNSTFPIEQVYYNIEYKYLTKAWRGGTKGGYMKNFHIESMTINYSGTPFNDLDCMGVPHGHPNGTWFVVENGIFINWSDDAMDGFQNGDTKCIIRKCVYESPNDTGYSVRGIKLHNASNVIIYQCKFLNWEIVHDNSASGIGAAISLDGSSGILVAYTEMYNIATHGIQTFGGYDQAFINNTIVDVGFGGYTWGGGSVTGTGMEILLNDDDTSFVLNNIVDCPNITGRDNEIELHNMAGDTPIIAGGNNLTVNDLVDHTGVSYSGTDIELGNADFINRSTNRGLQGTSDAVDAGAEHYLIIPYQFDILGNIINGVRDIGAYERQ